MSRICVKKLPKEVAEAQLRDIFSRKGEITDVKLLRTKEGRSRQMAFIGFRSENEAQEAIKYFNNYCLRNLHLTVEIAHEVGDENAPHTWSRHSRKKETKFSENGGKSSDGIVTKKRKNGPEVDDPLLKEFLDVMLRGKSKMWSNDISIAPTAEVASKVKVLVKKADDPVVSNGVERKKAKGSSDTQKIKKRKVVAPTDDVSDSEYFKSRIKKNLSDSDSDREIDGDEDEADADVHDAGIHIFPIDGNDGDAMGVEFDGKMTQESKADSDDVLDTGRLFVHNLPYTTTEEDLRKEFSKFGEISEVHLHLDKETKRSKGFAFIRYQTPESAAKAMKELAIFQGRLLHVVPAKPRETPDKQVDNTSNKPKTLKQRKEEQRKASEAGGNTKAWNSLFMRQDTILENVVRWYGVSKSEFFDRESDDPAVRLALAEANVIEATKEALFKAGVNVASLEEFAAGKGDENNRSKNILLVKNLPFASTEEELEQMFGKFGSLDKIILPPTKTMALVVFLEPAEARAAFMKMLYKRYKDGPLYLEWAPGNILEPKTLPNNNEQKSDVGENDVRRVNLEQEVKIDPDVTESNVLYVTNLSFKTTDESLEQHLKVLLKQGNIRSVKITKHVKNRKNVSSGYGFVEFDSIEAATSVYSDFQGTSLDGHALKFRFSEHKRRDTDHTVGKGSDKVSTKLHVKNVPFEATKEDLKLLFSPFGQIKGLRLPKRNFGQSAGYAFVEFMTKQEASDAKKALPRFYGRRLLFEWATDDNSMEEKRRHSAAKYKENDSPKRRRTAE